jgi:hypothetical protein
MSLCTFSKNVEYRLYLLDNYFLAGVVVLVGVLPILDL